MTDVDREATEQLRELTNIRRALMLGYTLALREARLLLAALDAVTAERDALREAPKESDYRVYGRCDLRFRHEVAHPYSAFLTVGSPEINAWCPGQYSDCANCDDRKCMNCVLRAVHEFCDDDCPECCDSVARSVSSPPAGETK